MKKYHYFRGIKKEVKFLKLIYLNPLPHYYLLILTWVLFRINFKSIKITMNQCCWLINLIFFALYHLF